MSVFEKTDVTCPRCAAAVRFDLVHSVNAARRPDLRAAILDRSFQRQTCPGCAFAFRMAPRFTYLDVVRKQFFAVFPAAEIGQWAQLEPRALASFDRAYGPSSDAAKLGTQLQARTVFGWAALNEKLIAAEAGIDDRTLELAKVAVMRTLGELKVGDDREFRFVGADAEQIVVGWLRTSTEDLDEELAVPRSLLADVEAEAAGWAELRGEIVGPMFVDYHRALIAPVAA